MNISSESHVNVSLSQGTEVGGWRRRLLSFWVTERKVNMVTFLLLMSFQSCGVEFNFLNLLLSIATRDKTSSFNHTIWLRKNRQVWLWYMVSEKALPALFSAVPCVVVGTCLVPTGNPSCLPLHRNMVTWLIPDIRNRYLPGYLIAPREMWVLSRAWLVFSTISWLSVLFIWAERKEGGKKGAVCP